MSACDSDKLRLSLPGSDFPINEHFTVLHHPLFQKDSDRDWSLSSSYRYDINRFEKMLCVWHHMWSTSLLSSCNTINQSSLYFSHRVSCWWLVCLQCVVLPHSPSETPDEASTTWFIPFLKAALNLTSLLIGTLPCQNLSFTWPHIISRLVPLRKLHRPNASMGKKTICHYWRIPQIFL